MNLHFNRVKFFLTGLMLAIFLLPGCQLQKKQKIIKLAHILDPTHSVHKAMEYMADQVEKKSGGTLIIQIYPSGQLGNERECLELLQIGSLGITKVSAAVIEGFVEEYKVLGLPYIFRNKAHAETVLDGPIGKKLLLASEDIWLRGLCFYDAGSRSFYTKDRPINSPRDLKGMKIRVMKSITAVNMVNALGASPTPIAFGELYTALQSGVVDGAENNPPSFYLSRHYEVCNYYSLDEHTTIPDVLLISTIVWNTLSEEEQDWLQEAVDESLVLQRELWKASEKDALESVQKAGVKIIYPEKSAFTKKVDGLYDNYKNDTAIYNLIRAIKNTGIKEDTHEIEIDN
jgi:tripartite ATP-independent transporter DctP family solute receptor